VIVFMVVTVWGTIVGPQGSPTGSADRHERLGPPTPHRKQADAVPDPARTIAAAAATTKPPRFIRLMTSRSQKVLINCLPTPGTDPTQPLPIAQALAFPRLLHLSGLVQIPCQLKGLIWEVFTIWEN
jgi:hypothetical protein